MLRARKIIGFLLLLAACAPAPDASRTDATQVARRAIGPALPYEAEALTLGDADLFRHSVVARRQFAWRAVARALGATGGAQVEVPRWASWYARDDYQRIFHKLYDDLGKDGRKARRPFAAADVAAAERWNLHSLDDLPNWPESRYQAWLASLGSDAARRGVAGLNRTFYSPAVTEHVAENYPVIDACLDGLPALPFDWKNPDPNNFTACFGQEFGAGAAAVKTSWRRRDFGLRVGAYATDAASLTRRLAASDSGWGAPDSEEDPADQEIYTIALEGGSRFQLAGLHLMTKELREWVWITLWWSPRPDQDFGEDRPEAIRALGGPWSHYKMCVVTAFDEQGGFTEAERAAYPTLAAAFDGANSQLGGASWCSNPYIEEGAHNQRSNCMGCHQHAGSSLDPKDILAGGDRFPKNGAVRVRENFPSDYLWSFAKDPERLSGYIRNQISHYDIYDNL